MAKKIAITALALAVMGCGAPASNSASAEATVAPEAADNTMTDASATGPENAATSTAAQVADTSMDGAARAIRFSDGSTVQLQGLKIDVREGLSDGKCAVSIGDQRIDTVGSGELEVYTCGALVDAGALPPTGDARRIGLIYRVSSPNAQFQTALILIDQNGKWTLDAESAGAFDDAPEAKSIEALAKTVGGAR